MGAEERAGCFEGGVFEAVDHSSVGCGGGVGFGAAGCGAVDVAVWFVSEPALWDEFGDVCFSGGYFRGLSREVARVVVAADDVEMDVGAVSREGGRAAVDGELFWATAIDFGAADDNGRDA